MGDGRVRTKSMLNLLAIAMLAIAMPAAGDTALAVVESGTNRADDPYGSDEEAHGGAGDDAIFGSGDLFGEGATTP